MIQPAVPSPVIRPGSGWLFRQTQSREYLPVHFISRKQTVNKQ